MAYIYTPSQNISGIDDIIADTISNIPVFSPMLLLFIYFFVLLSGVVSQKRRLGTADFPMWFVMAGLSTLLVALILSLKEGLIQVEVLSVVVIVTIFSGIWLFLDRNRNEV